MESLINKKGFWHSTLREPMASQGAAVAVDIVESKPAQTHILLSITSRESNFWAIRAMPPSKYDNLDSDDRRPAAPCKQT